MIPYPLHLSIFRLNIISVLIRINLEILWINFIAAEIVQKLPASVTQNRKNIFLNTGNGKKSWEWRKMDSKIISIHSRIREKHNGNKPGNFWHKARNSCPYRRNDQFGAKKSGKSLLRDSSHFFNLNLTIPALIAKDKTRRGPGAKNDGRHSDNLTIMPYICISHSQKMKY